MWGCLFFYYHTRLFVLCLWQYSPCSLEPVVTWEICGLTLPCHNMECCPAVALRHTCICNIHLSVIIESQNPIVQHIRWLRARYMQTNEFEFGFELSFSIYSRALLWTVVWCFCTTRTNTSSPITGAAVVRNDVVASDRGSGLRHGGMSYRGFMERRAWPYRFLEQTPESNAWGMRANYADGL